MMDLQKEVNRIESAGNLSKLKAATQGMYRAYRDMGLDAEEATALVLGSMSDSTWHVLAALWCRRAEARQ